MNPTVTAFVGLAILATSNALPLGNGIAGIGLAPGSLGTYWDQEVTFGKAPMKIGFGYNRGGTMTAGVRYQSSLSGKPAPVVAAVSGNLKDLKKTLKFEVGARLLNSIAGVLYGDSDGYKWLSSLWLPVPDRGGLNAVGIAVEGDRGKPVAITGGVGIRKSVYQTRVTLDKHLKPDGSTFHISPSFLE